MPPKDVPNLLAESGLPIAYAAAISAENGLPDNAGYANAIRTTVRSLTVMQKEAIVASTRSSGVWRLSSDEGPYLDGHDYAPAPLAFMTAGLVAETMTSVEAAIGETGSVGRLRLTLDTYFSMQGSMRAGTMTGGAYDPELLIETDSPIGDIRSGTTGVAASASAGLLRQAHVSPFSLSTHGRAIDVGAFPKIDALPDPGEAALSPAVQTPEQSEAVVEKIVDVGDKPPDSGVSLQETQDRRLFLRAVCERRADGVKVIDVWVHRPNGSTFRFLSDEPEGHGGHGRAPDGMSLISAGIGFCFMTQIGRFAKIVRSPLGNYHIVQDTRFSRGRPWMGEPADASTIARAAAPQTHVFLRPDDDDDFARHALAMSEQTCFLHALCRTKLHTKVRFGLLAD